jgi:FtsH-binding integral membrane protein
MTAASATSPMKDRSRGRALFWAGIGLCLLGLAAYIVQFSLKQLVVPWYMAVLETIGALLLAWSVARRRSIPRIIALVLVAALAAFEWYFLGSLSKLPAYAGPAQAGQTLPAFRTTLADGRAFTEQDLQDGAFSVLVFFRGRW